MTLQLQLKTDFYLGKLAFGITPPVSEACLHTSEADSVSVDGNHRAGCSGEHTTTARQALDELRSMALMHVLTIFAKTKPVPPRTSDVYSVQSIKRWQEYETLLNYCLGLLQKGSRPPPPKTTPLIKRKKGKSALGKLTELEDKATNFFTGKKNALATAATLSTPQNHAFLNDVETGRSCK
ncbi:hypothetical protein Tco_0052355 [Tanacetum coccineum]